MHRGFYVVGALVIALAIQYDASLRSRWFVYLQSHLMARVQPFAVLPGLKFEAAVRTVIGAVPGADFRTVPASSRSIDDARDRGLSVQQVDQTELDLQVWWHAPFLSAGGYASEAVAFATALDDSEALPIGALRISQHGDGISGSIIEVCWIQTQLHLDLKV